MRVVRHVGGLLPIAALSAGFSGNRYSQRASPLTAGQTRPSSLTNLDPKSIQINGVIDVLGQHLKSQADDYYGGFDSSFMVKEFSLYEQLEDIVNLASKPLPERPDGIVTVAKFTSASREDCRASEAAYERLARKNPSSIFLRSFEEMEGADALFARARVNVLPCFDVFYQGNRVARIEGSRYSELETLLQQYQMLNSDLDLFSESSTYGENSDPAAPWGSRKGSKSSDFTKTPRTTAAFIPGYDWNTKDGFFDEWANKAQESFDFEKSYGEWLPNTEDK